MIDTIAKWRIEDGDVIGAADLIEDGASPSVFAEALKTAADDAEAAVAEEADRARATMAALEEAECKLGDAADYLDRIKEMVDLLLSMSTVEKDDLVALRDVVVQAEKVLR